MEFDKSRCYSAINADELHVGDKVINAQHLGNLKYQVSQKDYRVWTIKEIKEDIYSNRFVTDDGAFPLVYLIERAENCTNCELCERTNASDDEEYECSPKGYIGDKERAKICRCLEWKSKTEQKVEKQYRPFVNTDELIKVWCEKGGKWQKRELTMPLIWVRYKTNQCGQKGILITKYEKNYVQIEGDMIAMHALMADYEFLDDSPCGVEE